MGRVVAGGVEAEEGRLFQSSACSPKMVRTQGWDTQLDAVNMGGTYVSELVEQ
jgi:hypothetical protein